MKASRLRWQALVAELAIVFLCFAQPALAHVGSPNVFFDGDAGAYHLFVTVNVPQVIPGVAEVQIRAASNDVREISTVVTRLAGAGSQYAPVPDVAVRSTVDPRLFTSSIWLMEYGSLRVLLKVSGNRGSAEMSVPVASFARQTLPMPRWLGAILLTLAIALALGAVSIIGAAAREARLPPGALVTKASRRSGLAAMAVSAVVVVSIFYLAFAWWSIDAAYSARLTRFFKPPRLTLTVDGGNRLRLAPADSTRTKYLASDELLLDHGHLMHMFLVRTPSFDRFWHLHPKPNGDGSFEASLPSLDAGHYDVFADVVDKSGFPWTLVGAIDLPQIKGAILSEDDSGGSFTPIREPAPDNLIDSLSDGTRVEWRHARLTASTPLVLHFKVENLDGSPATDMQPYMGMAAHLEIVRNDLSVFAHLHPSGSAPMAALMLASNESGANSGSKTMTMADGSMMTMSAKVEPDLSIPYGFPKPGLYRVFVQFKRAGKVETAIFDVHVD
jgi:hypothetical protein